ncbi:MAG TPA: hypothetical protein PLY40_09785 [Bacillota bacterium]|nr:hypothetical protein [Bacillota bacterium]
MERYNKLLESAITALNRAVDQLKQSTVPRTAMPRPRVFRITRNVVWPQVHDTGTGPLLWKVLFFEESGKSRSIEYEYVRREVAEMIARSCGYQPRKILAALRRLQAATAWCYARAEGRKRQAEEILRQQASALEILEAEAALQALE